MSDTVAEAGGETGEITYHEPHELGFLERLLLDRRLTPLNAIMFGCVAISIALALFHLLVAVFGTPEGRSFRSIHLTVMLVLAVLIHPLFRGSMREPVIVPGGSRNLIRGVGFAIDLALIAVVLFVQIWTIWDIDAFHMRLGEKESSDLIIGGIFILIVLEATRRAVGWAMVIITGFFIFHALNANYFFGFFYGPPVRFGKFIDSLFMSSDGIFGIPLYVAATYIILFIIFGAVLIRSGAGRFFIDLAVSLTGHRIGGPAKAAAVASGFMGTVSGSAVANVVTTGSFTIPLMKQVGYRPKFAAAVEACASSGGQITPPIMGAAAFIMAEFLETSYVNIIIAAIIPALLYFATIYFMVHLEAEKHGIGAIPKERLPRTGAVLRRGWHLLIALFVLIGFLLYGYTPMKSAFFGLASLIGLSFVNPATRMSPVDMLAALEAGVRATVPVSIACACAGLIIGSVFVSGLGLKFTQSVIEIADGNLLVLLMLTGVAAIVLGMGITTTAVYITVAALIVPAVIKSGVEPIAAHMFAFYFGVVSTITPPVALAAFAAAAIAKTPPMATAIEASRVGIAKYLAPLIFVYNPALLFVGPVWFTAVSASLALAGLWVLSMAIEGWYRGRMAGPQRLVLLGGAILLLFPPNHNFIGMPGYLLVLAGALASSTILVPR
ncbi:MAG TPA: TRAP transporter fused permease subunit, partial [Thermohalobaculum sp.]|nr:TRAP transporter fused permease subunit [Thermohalobaculum sp.]